MNRLLGWGLVLIGYGVLATIAAPILDNPVWITLLLIIGLVGLFGWLAVGFMILIVYAWRHGLYRSNQDRGWLG